MERIRLLLIAATSASTDRLSAESPLSSSDNVLLTDREGTAVFVVVPTQTYTLVAGFDDLRYESARIHLPPLDRGDVRHVVVHLAAGLSCVGQVIDDATDDPIPGAEFVLPGRNEAVYYSDERGMFAVSGSINGILLVRRRGYATLQLLIGDCVPEDLLQVRMVRSAHLEVLLVDVYGNGLSNHRVSVTSDRTSLARDEPAWSATTDAYGRCVFEDVASNIPLAVQGAGDGGLVARFDAPLSLSPGEHRLVRLLAEAGGTVRGLALESGRVPVAELPVVLLPVNRCELLLAASLLAPDGLRAVTNAEGRFMFSGVPPGKWCLGVLHGDAERLSVATPRVLVDVDSRRPTPLQTLVVWRGLFIRGIVVDPTGARMRDIPEGSGRVTATSAACLARTQVQADGTFAVGPLAPGVYIVEARVGIDWAASSGVSCAVGQEGVVVPLRYGYSMSGVVVDTSGKGSNGATVSIANADERAQSAAQTSATSDGYFVFRGLPSGRYTLRATSRTGEAGWLHEVVVADSGVCDQEVRVEPAGRLAVTVRGADPLSLRCVVHLNGHRWISQSFVNGPSIEFVLPPGDVTVSLVRANMEDPIPPLTPSTLRVLANERTDIVIDVVSPAR